MNTRMLRSVAALTGGNALAMAIPILAAPVLGRLYVPSHYAALAQFIAPAAILSVLATLQFQHAIIAEKSNRAASAATWLCIFSSTTVGALTALAVAGLWTPVILNSAAGLWFVVLPLTVAGSGVLAAGSFQANRHRRYHFIAVLQVIHVLVTVAMSIVLGVFNWGANGLLLAYLCGQLVQFIAYTRLLIWANVGVSWPKAALLRVFVRRNRKFPVFTLPNALLGQFAMQAPVFALSALGADGTLGAFNRARQLVSMPVTILGQSVAQVFRRDAAELYRSTGSCRSLILRTSGSLFLSGALPCVIFIASSPWLFTIYLGPAWREAGEIAQILAPMLLLRLIVSPTTTVLLFTENQKLGFLLTFGGSIVLLTSIVVAISVSENRLLVIVAYSVVYSFIYLVFFFAAYIVANSPIRRTILN